MDALTHGLIGYIIAGPPGAVAGVVADAPFVLADAWQISSGRLPLMGALRGDYECQRPDRFTRALLIMGRYMHSCWGCALVVLGPVGWAYAAHVVMDIFVHAETWLLPPFGGHAQSGLRWRGRDAVLSWALLTLAILLRS